MQSDFEAQVAQLQSQLQLLANCLSLGAAGGSSILPSGSLAPVGISPQPSGGFATPGGASADLTGLPDVVQQEQVSNGG